MTDSPASILYDKNGKPHAVNDGVAIPAGTPAVLVAGKDNSNTTRYFIVDSLGVAVVGAGTAGAPAGGVLSVQGVPGGEALPVAGDVTAAQGAPAALADAWPTVITDGVAVLGTSTDPVRVDPTGTTAQPVTDGGGSLTVDGAVTANIGTPGALALDATLTGGTATSIVRGGTKGATTPEDITSTDEGADHRALDVQIYHGGTAKDPTQIRALTSSDVVTAAQGTASAISEAWPTKLTDGTDTADVTAAGALKVDGSAVTQPVSDGGGSLTVDGTVTSNQGTAAALSGFWPVRHTDGVNATPAGDAVSRAIFEKITDGTNIAAVKAASTAATTTDPALVVAVSPNNTVKAQLFDANGNTLALTDGTAVPVNQQAILTSGYDGTNAQFILTDSGGRQIVAGAAASGSAVTGNPVLIGGSDGANAQTVLYNVPAFMASTNGTVNTGTVLATTTSIAYLFHTAASTVRREIRRIDVGFAFQASNTAGSFTIRLARIIAENATPLGTVQTINSVDGANSVGANATFRTGATGAPTRAPGDYASFSAGSGACNLYTWEPGVGGKPLVLRAGVAEGFEIRTIVSLALNNVGQVSVTFYWTER